jgi:hypothetical protein
LQRFFSCNRAIAGYDFLQFRNLEHYETVRIQPPKQPKARLLPNADRQIQRRECSTRAGGP